MTGKSDRIWKAGGYVAEAAIGQGASATVWRGRAVRSGALVALKRIDCADDGRRRAAQTEAGLLSTLDHPNLIRLLDMVPDGDSLVLVLDLAAGGSLADLLDRRPRLAAGEVVSALSPIGAALAYAHDAGVTHCDVSPANILFTEHGTPLLADLGTARLLGHSGLPQATLAYVDPVVATGGVAGPPSDVFALAGVALQALTGCPPWTGPDAEAVLRAAAGGVIADLDAALATVPAGLASLLRRALAAAPPERGTAAEFALDLRHAVTPLPIEISAGRSVPGPHRPRHAAPISSPPKEGPASIGSVGAREAGAVGAGAAGSGRVGPGRTGPGYDRPAFTRPGPDAADAIDSGLVATHAVRARARPVLDPPRRWWCPPVVPGRLLLAGAAVAAAVALAVSVIGHPFGSPRTASAPAAAPGSPSRPAPTSVPANASAAGAAATEVDWTAILAGLDRAREQAFATADPGALAAVYVNGPLLNQDTATLTRLTAPGCQVVGLQTRYSNVTLIDRAPDLVTVRASAALDEAEVRCGGVVSAHTAARAGTGLTIGLTPVGAGYRISTTAAG